MATFERYFIDATETHEEPKNAYYRLFEKEEIVDKILKEFGLPVQGAHIINGHIPVIVKKGESPVKCGGKLLVWTVDFPRHISRRPASPATR